MGRPPGLVPGLGFSVLGSQQEGCVRVPSQLYQLPSPGVRALPPPGGGFRHTGLPARLSQAGQGRGGPGHSQKIWPQVSGCPEPWAPRRVRPRFRACLWCLHAAEGAAGADRSHPGGRADAAAEAHGRVRGGQDAPRHRGFSGSGQRVWGSSRVPPEGVSLYHRHPPPVRMGPDPPPRSVQAQLVASRLQGELEKLRCASTLGSSEAEEAMRLKVQGYPLSPPEAPRAARSEGGSLSLQCHSWRPPVSVTISIKWN